MKFGSAGESPRGRRAAPDEVCSPWGAGGLSNERQRVVFWRQGTGSPRAQARVARRSQCSRRLAGLDLAELAVAEA